MVDVLLLTGKCPANPALRAGSLPAGGRKGHNIKGNGLTGKPNP